MADHLRIGDKVWAQYGFKYHKGKVVGFTPDGDVVVRFSWGSCCGTNAIDPTRVVHR